MTMPRSNAAGIGLTSLDGGGSSVLAVPTETPGIRNVWAFNLDDEMHAIGRIVQQYKYVALDTEFPGFVITFGGRNVHRRADCEYQRIRSNANVLKLIQLGIAFMDEYGNKPQNDSTWQFNFKFNLKKNLHDRDAIDLLIRSGIDFDRHEKEGIDQYEFSKLFVRSGVVLQQDVTLICFHGGFDMAYVLKLLMGKGKLLPLDKSEFLEMINIYFPVLYDVKYLAETCTSFTGGLRRLADRLGVQQVGTPHQAGSDSLLTGEVFFKMREVFFEGQIKNAELCGSLFGLGGLGAS